MNVIRGGRFKPFCFLNFSVWLDGILFLGTPPVDFRAVCFVMTVAGGISVSWFAMEEAIRPGYVILTTVVYVLTIFGKVRGQHQ